MQEIDQRSLGMQGIGLFSSFAPWELEQMPSSFQKAAQRAEHNELVRKRLHILQQPKHTILSGADGSHANKCRQKSAKSGRIGPSDYEHLVLKPLARIDKCGLRVDLDGEVPTLNSGDVINHSRPGSAHSTINVHVKRLVADIGNVSWLTTEERENLANAFIIELAIRYNQMRDLMSPKLTAPQNRIVLTRILEHITRARDAILRKCRRKKMKMEEAHVFDHTSNNSRLRAYFRTEFSRRVDTEAILKQALIDTDGGNTLPDTDYTRQSDILKMEVQEVKDALERTTHPTPYLQAPVISAKHQTELLRRTIRQSSITEPGIEHDILTRIARQSSQRQSGMLDSRRRSSVVDQSRRHSIRRLSSFEQNQPRYQAVLEESTDAIVSSANIEGMLWDVAEGDQSSSYGSEDENDLEGDIYEVPDDEKDITALAVIEADDPLLRGHAGVTAFQRRIDIAEEEALPRSRYLPPSTYRKRHLTDFDYSLFDTLSLSSTPPDGHTSKPTYNLLDDETAILRPIESKVSERIPKGFISLTTEPTATVGEFGTDTKDSLLSNIDGKLARNKEVEELYDEIMKPMRRTHLEPDQTEEPESFACPAAPIDPQMPKSWLWQGLADPVLIPPATEVLKPMESSANVNHSVAAIRLRPREGPASAFIPPPLHPDDFIKDRRSAMRQTLSSRYHGAFRYNYGGYLPFDPDTKHRAKSASDISTADYLSFLRTKATDFVFNLLYKEDEYTEMLRKAQEEERERQRIEEEHKRRENERRERAEKRRQMLSYERGEWNPKIIDFMAELNGTEMEAAENAVRNTTALSIEQPNHAPRAIAQNETRAQPEQAEPLTDARHATDESTTLPLELYSIPTSAPAPTQAGMQRPDSVDIRQMQKELEALWVTLKMPLDQKVDMAIKYGGHRFAPKLETAIRLWKMASDHIIARETLLGQIEAFERTASDPDRFFQKGPEGSSAARLKEAKDREEFMRQLHHIEARITDITTRIKLELKESVTYEGKIYKEKMRTDYTEMIKRLQRDRRAQGTLQR